MWLYVLSAALLVRLLLAARLLLDRRRRGGVRTLVVLGSGAGALQPCCP